MRVNSGYHANLKGEKSMTKEERCEYCRCAVYTDKPFKVTTQMGFELEVVFKYCPVCGNELPKSEDEHA